ncbi:MAG TPA: tetratricopeptide repeat protein, partial [Planctomicrobium sp.]|nr:tetratricopeptide repeat protein [Planctomicrobium sp.]
MNVNRLSRGLLYGLLCLLFIVPSAVADPVSDYNVAVEFYKQKRWQLAVDSCEEFLKNHPQHERAPSVRLYQAQALLHLKKYAEARSQFEQFLTQAPDHLDRPLAMYRVGECSSFLGDDLAVETQFTQFLKSYPKHELAEWALLYLGEAQFRLKRYEAAVKTFEQSLNSYPEGRLRDDVEFNLAGVYTALQQPEKAEELLQKIAARTGGSRAGEALFQLGARQFDRREFEQAAQTFLQLATEHPSHALVSNSQLNAGYALYSLGRYQDAITAFSSAASDARFAPLANFWKGLSQKNLGEFAAAGTTFNELQTKYPEFPQIDKVTFHFADVEFRQGHLDQAIKLFEQVAVKHPESEFADDALHAAGEAALQAKQYDKANALHQQFVERFSESPLRPVEEILAARVLMAQVANIPSVELSRKQYDQAADLLRTLIEQNTDERIKSIARFHLARAYEGQGDFQKVVETLTPILSTPNGKPQSLNMPELQDARLLRANAYLRLNQSEPALEDYRLYLDNSQSPPERIVGLTGLARGMTQTHKWADLQKVLEELNEIDKNDSQFSRVAMSAGDAAFDQKQWNESQSFFQMVINRGDAGEYALPALSGLAHALYENKQFTESTAAFLKLSEATEKDLLLQSHAAYMHAFSLQQSGDKAQALTAYQTAAEKFSRRKETRPLSEQNAQIALNALRCEQGAARLARDTGDRPRADQLYSMAYDELKALPEGTPPGRDQLLNEWANMAYSAEDYARSDELYARLIAECPESSLVPESQLILGESARFGGKIPQAMETFRQLSTSAQADDFVRQRALVHLLDLTTQAGQWNDALKLAEQLQKDFPGGPHAFYAAYREGEAQLKLKAYDKAVTVLQKAKSTLPENLAQAPVWWPEIWLMLGECHYWKKDYPQLDQILDELRSKDPPTAVLYRLDALQG